MPLYHIMMRRYCLMPHLVYYQLAIIGCLWLCLMLHYA
jgi:hypothetical protein